MNHHIEFKRLIPRGSFQEDVLECPRCTSSMQLIVVIDQPNVMVLLSGSRRSIFDEVVEMSVHDMMT